MTGFWSLDRVRAALGDELRGARPAGAQSIGAVSTDTRRIGRDDIFVALRGERFNGR